MTGLERTLISIPWRMTKDFVFAGFQAFNEYHFRSFFGKDACDAGRLFLVLDPHENAIPISPVTQNRYVKRFYGRHADISLPGADPILGSGAIRATNYASAEASKYIRLDNALKVCLDVDVRDSWDGSFICYGSSSSNIKTYDIEHMPEMNLYEMGTTLFHGVNIPCWRMNGQDYTVMKRSDRAVLLRMRNPRSPGNYLFVCAGLGEWGSTGAVRFLFRNWRTLHRLYKNGANFCLIIDVEKNSDESAREIAAFSP